MRRRRRGAGRIFRRTSRATGRELPTYWVAYYVRDAATGRVREVRESTETTDYDEAQRYLHKKLGEAAEGRPKPVHLDRVTVAELLELVVRDYADQGQRVPPGHVEALRRELGALRALDVKRSHLDDVVRRWRREGVHVDRAGNRPAANGTCNRYMATLRRAFSLGREKLELETALTFPHLEEAVRGRYIPPGDFQAILAQIASPTKRAFCELAYLTGVRKGQLRATELANVDADRWVLTWRPDQTKTKEPHTLPLVGRARELVETLWKARRLDCRYLFHEQGEPLGTLRSEWRRACRRAGFTTGRARGYTFHDTRHSCVSNLHAAGVPDSVAMSITNHRTTAVFLRYGIRHEQAQRAALESVQTYLSSLPTSASVRPLPGHTTDTPRAASRS